MSTFGFGEKSFFFMLKNISVSDRGIIELAQLV